jgi:hypothetical protein
MYNDCIYTKPHSIPDELCDEIQRMFDEEGDNRGPGNTHGGINAAIKDTLDFTIPKQSNKWAKIDQFLADELNLNLGEYLKSLSTIPEYSLFDKKYFSDSVFMLQRYTKSKGKYIYHNDFGINYEDGTHRVITYLWYLNDVDEGGQTELWGNRRIKPEKGKLVLFPSHWAFPHTGKMPISHDKLIITGWLYKSFQ